MTKSNTVLQKFWERVFDQPDAVGIKVRNEHREPRFFPTAIGSGTTMSIYTPPAWINMSVRQVGHAVGVVGQFLKKKGIERGDRVAIIAWNCPEFLVLYLAVQSLGCVIVPIYPNNGPDQVNYIVEDAEAKFLFSNDKDLLAKHTSGVAETVLFDSITAAFGSAENFDKYSFIAHFAGHYDLSENKGLFDEVQRGLYFFHEFIISNYDVVKPEELAALPYTSGSTGLPKGVMVTHDNLAAACEGMVGHGLEVFPESDSYVSYLPAAHIYEQVAGMMLCQWTGIPSAFFPNVKKVGEVLPELRPTLFHGVPAIWRGIMDKVYANATGWKGKVLNWALQVDENDWLCMFFADLLVFRKIRNALGGKIRLATSGGAPLSAETVIFFRKAGIEILQGYGLTETTAAITCNRPTGTVPGICNKPGTVGTVIANAGTEIRIAAIEGWQGQGEIQVRGRQVMKGYWKKPEETAKSFTEDGWFRTGDIGYFDKDGFLVITDRLKRLLKTEGGKYVAPQKIEKAFETCPIVQCVVPVGHGKPFIAGLIFVNKQIAVDMLSANGVALDGGTDIPAFLASHKLVLDAVQKAVDSVNAKLEHWEQLRKFTIIPVDATVENGLLTPTQKIRLEEVNKRYAVEVEAFYARPRR
jgi:long-chain acyl-CoA synthetase